VYSRISNPTTRVLEQRLAAMESGMRGAAAGCIATSSGMAAITAVMMSLLRADSEILSASGIFGGTCSLFVNTLSRFGVSTVFVEQDDPAAFARAVTNKTRLLFIEAIGNPRMNMPDVRAIARVSREYNLPLVVDATLVPPCVARMGCLGADIVIHSTTKYINGHGTAVGGALIDTGNYDWRKGIFPDLQALARRTGPYALLGYLRQTIYRDLGGCPAPLNSFLMLQGIETLAPRTKMHDENAKALAAYLKTHPQVHDVRHPSLPDSPSREIARLLYNGYGGGLLTFRMGSREKAMALINAVRLMKNMTNIGDAKTLILHPASTIFHEYNAEECRRMGVYDDMVRISFGIEDVRDLTADLEQAFSAVAAIDVKAVVSQV